VHLVPLLTGVVQGGAGQIELSRQLATLKYTGNSPCRTAKVLSILAVFAESVQRDGRPSEQEVTATSRRNHFLVAFSVLLVTAESGGRDGE